MEVVESRVPGAVLLKGIVFSLIDQQLESNTNFLQLVGDSFLQLVMSH